MKELNRTDRLTIATVIVAVIFIVGLVTLKKPEIPYSQSAKEMVNMLATNKDYITPEEVEKIVNDKDPHYYIIDVRNPVDFRKSHIGNAINISSQQILDETNRNNFADLAREGVTIILYGKDQLDANGAYVMLKQTGIENVKVMPGGFEYYSRMISGQIPVSGSNGYLVEKPEINYKEVMDSLGTKAQTEERQEPKKLNIIKREKKTKVEGGC